MKFRNLLLYFMALSLVAFTACDDDDDDDETGSVRVEITDAPVDDTEVESVFVTIADIRVDGESLDGYDKTTINLMAYQQGNTKLLTTSDLEADTYGSMTLILDFDENDNGTSPGCYVEETDGTQHKLTSTSSDIDVLDGFTISGNTQTDLVIDFDLRKTIKRESGGNDDYDFVAESNMSTAIRIADKNQTGVISGSCNDAVTGSDQVIVYAYHKGYYDRAVETTGSADSDLKFHNAVSSAEVDSNNDYELHFLTQGEYELVFATYQRDPSTGQLELTGTLLVDTSVNLESVMVDATVTTTVNVDATGILPL